MKNLFLFNKLKNTCLLLLLSLLCLAASCKGDDDMPNPPSRFDIVTCKVNGVYWEAFDYTEGDIFGWGGGATDLQYYSDTQGFSLRAVRELEDQSINQSINQYYFKTS